MEKEIDIIERKTDEIEGETDKKKLKIIRIANVIEITSVIFNTFSFNETIVLRRLLFYYT